MKNYKYSCIGAGLACLIFLGAVIFDADLFEAFIAVLSSLEDHEVDEVIIPLIILLLFAAFDLVRKQRSLRVEQERIKIYHATLESTSHVLDNIVHQLQMFKMTAERTPGFDSRVLSLYHVVMEDASLQLDKLSNLDRIDEDSIRSAVPARPGAAVHGPVGSIATE